MNKRLRLPSGARVQFSLRREASGPRPLEILNAAVKFMEANWSSKSGLIPDS